jgi:hypothetical protein
MSRAGGKRLTPETTVTTSAAIRVSPNQRGAWEVALPDQPEPISCQTLADARRVAILSAALGPDRQLIVQDAYHRVVRREKLGDREGKLVPDHGWFG